MERLRQGGVTKSPGTATSTEGKSGAANAVPSPDPASTPPPLPRRAGVTPPNAPESLLCHHFGSVDSTNRVAIELLKKDAPGHAFVVTADTQTGGYGRHGRKWQSPPGGLWWSLAWPVNDESPLAASSAGVRIGSACRSVIAQALSSSAATPRVTLKWPNDVLIEGKKVAGCLCERVSDPSGRPWLIVGVGINVNNDPAGLPADIRRPATSLRSEIGADVDLAALGRALTQRIAGALGASSDVQVRRQIVEAAEFLDGLDRPARLLTPGGGNLQGTLSGLMDDGRLVLDVDGRRVVAPAGAEFAPSGVSEQPPRRERPAGG